MFDSVSVYLPGILLTYSAFLILLLSPGPNIMAVMGTSMSVDRKSGISLGLGIAGGTLFWSCLTVLGVASFITAYAWSLLLLKIFGGMYLIWLAFRSFQLAYSIQNIGVEHAAASSSLKYFILGFTINVSNPKAAFGWVAIVSLGMKPDAPTWVSIALILGTVTTSVICHVLCAVLFSTQPLISMYKRANRWIHGLVGAFFLFAGIKVLTSKT